MENRLNIIIIVIFLFLGISGIVWNEISQNFSLGNSLITFGFGLMKFSSIVLLLRNSNFLRSKYFAIIAGFVFLCIIGALFKLMHWPGAAIIFGLSTLGIVITYGIRFLKKINRDRIDILKFLWVTTTFLSETLIILKFNISYVRYLPDVILIILVVDFIRCNSKQQSLNA